MILSRLAGQGLAHPPKWLPANTFYLTEMGSVAYGVAGQSSDVDLYGVCFPPKEDVFPWTAGHIPGFAPQPAIFTDWQQHHIKSDKHEYDFAIYGIVRFFALAAANNPNILDSLYTPRRCVRHMSEIGERLRSNRGLFLTREVFNKFRGYAYQQIAKIEDKRQSANPKRAASIAAHGYDTKAGYHVVRLALEAEQLLSMGSMTLDQQGPLLSAIRNGEWTLARLKGWFEDKEIHLERLTEKSWLPAEPDWDRLKTLLLECLEHHYGSMTQAIATDTSVEDIVRDLEGVISRYTRG